MKVGDLVKFTTHAINTSPLGVVLQIYAGGAPVRHGAEIAWCCEYTPDGRWSVSLLEVISESR